MLLYLCRQLPHEKSVHIPLWILLAIASERRAVGAILTGKARLFAFNFSKIHDFQQVGKNDRGKFVQNSPNFQSDWADCHSKMATYDNFRVNCHKKRAIFEWTPTLNYGVKEVVIFLDIVWGRWKIGKIRFSYSLNYGQKGIFNHAVKEIGSRIGALLFAYLL